MVSEDKALVSPNKQLIVQVKGDSPVDAPPALFSNFLGITRVAMDVQFEFVFVDLNQVVQLLQGADNQQPAASTPVVGQTVAKIIMPAAVFGQLKDHIARMMTEIEGNLAELEGAKHASTSAKSTNTDERKASNS